MYVVYNTVRMVKIVFSRSRLVGGAWPWTRAVGRSVESSGENTRYERWADDYSEISISSAAPRSSHRTSLIGLVDQCNACRRPLSSSSAARRRRHRSPRTLRPAPHHTSRPNPLVQRVRARARPRCRRFVCFPSALPRARIVPLWFFLLRNPRIHRQRRLT